MEGTLLGIRSIAVSLVSRNHFRFDVAAEFTAKVARKVLRQGLPKDTLLNVNLPNIPAGEIRGVRITRQGKRIYGEAVVEKRDPRGRKNFLICGDSPRRGDHPRSGPEAGAQKNTSL